MFSRGNKASVSTPNAPAPSKSAPSIISSDLSISGDLVSSGEIQVDGKIVGNIECSALVVGVNGSAEGEIKAETVRLHGQVAGQINAKNVFLASTARMVGDIAHDSLAIEPGAFMEGRCVRIVERCETKEPALKVDLVAVDETTGDGSLESPSHGKGEAAVV